MSTLHLDKLLDPASIVLIGASARAGSPGLSLARNLIESDYTGQLHLVNPRYKEVLGQPCLRSLDALPETPELALLRTPVRLLRRTLVHCARRGIKVAIIMSGFPDSKRLHSYARRLGMRILGPWCAGIIRPHIGLNATGSASRVLPGSVAIISQSASLGSALLDWAESSGVGFSALLSAGGDSDIRLADLLDLLAEDRHTRAIIVYLDRVRSSRQFLSAISATARIKPVVLMRSTQEGAPWCDALTRTGHAHSSDAVFEAALTRAGVVRIRTFSNLFSASKMLASQARTRGRRLAVISNGAAPGMLACERIETKGFHSPFPDEERRAALAKQLGKRFSGLNPIVLRDTDNLPAQYTAAIDAIHDPALFDAILVIFVPDSRNDPIDVARAVLDVKPLRIPLLACWMGDASVAAARDTFAEAGVASFRTPEAATDAFDFLHRYRVSQQQLLQLPNPASRHTRADVGRARELVDSALAAGTRVLAPDATRQLLGLFDIEVLPARTATSIDEAASVATALAQEHGWPLVVKLVSENIAYKASLIPTRLNITDEAGVRAAWREIESAFHAKRPNARFDGVLIEKMHADENHRELAVAIRRDATFGPVISIGLGGDMTALGLPAPVQLPPLNGFLIDELLDTPLIANYLGPFRHRQAIDGVQVSHVLRQLSELACEIPEVVTLDINPLRVTARGTLAMDAQVVLETVHEERQYAHLAIHPYPWQWIRDVTLKDDREIQLRPIRPEDGKAIGDLVRGMSAESRFFRFMHAINELSPMMVAQFTKLDYDRQMAIVAVAQVDDGAEIIIGVSRYAINSKRTEGEFALSVADDWQGLGLASALMRLLIEHAGANGLQRLRGDVLRSNRPMQGLMKSLGFKATADPDDRDVIIYTCDVQ